MQTSMTFRCASSGRTYRVVPAGYPYEDRLGADIVVLGYPGGQRSRMNDLRAFEAALRRYSSPPPPGSRGSTGQPSAAASRIRGYGCLNAALVVVAGLRMAAAAQCEGGTGAEQPRVGRIGVEGIGLRASPARDCAAPKRPGPMHGCRDTAGEPGRTAPSPCR